MINKTIHYCWFGGNEMPALCERCLESWKQHLSDYKIKRWDESNIPKDIPFVNDMLKNKNWAFVSDYIRLYALFNEGGIYLDTDIEVIKPFDELLHHPVFLGEESKGRPTTGVIGSIKGHAYIKDCMNIMEKRHEQKKEYLITPEVAAEGLKKGHKDVAILPPETFYPYNPYDNSKLVSVLMYSDVVEGTYAIHHWNHAWKLGFVERLIRGFKRLINA